MTVSYIGGDTVTSAGAQSLTMTIPAGATTDDLMIAFMKQSENTGAQVWDDDGGGGNGWTREDYNRSTGGRDQETAIYWKIHDGSEPNPTFTWNSGGTNEPMTGILVVYRTDSSNGWANSGNALIELSWQWAQNDCNPPNPSVTISTSPACIVVFHAATHDDISSVGAPTGYTLREYQYGGSAGHGADHRDSFSADLLNSGLSTGSYTPPDWTHGASNSTPEYHTYTFYFAENPVIGINSVSSTDDDILADSPITVAGFNFEATQGTGKIEVADTDDYATATKVNQTTSLSWSDTSISFDLDEGAFGWGTLYVFVTNDSGDRTVATSFYFGLPAPEVTSVPCVILSGSDDLWVVGSNFEAAQGTGTLKLSSNRTWGSGTEPTQTIKSWSNNLIKFTANTTGLTNGLIYLFVDTDNDLQSPPIPVMLGTSTMQNYVDTILNPDHYHPFDANLEDAQNPGATQAWDDQQAGTPGLTADPLTRDTTNSYDFNDTTDKAERPNSAYVNVTNLHQRRQLMVWFKLDEIVKGLGLIYEEGGGVNNIYWSVGFGNKLLGNFSDENDFEIQAYSDKALKPNRVYMATSYFEGTNFENAAWLLVDGKRQSDTAGNPVGRATFSSHSGDLAIGNSASLNTGGTDIDYVGAPMNVAHWASWAGTETNGTMPNPGWTAMHHRLAFQLGALADETIASDTEANMQTWVENNLDNTSPADAACCLDIEAVSGGGDFTLTLTNVAFDPDASLFINYEGTDTLTLVNAGTTDITYDKVNSTAGGGIIIESPALVTINGAPTGSTIVLLDNATSNELGRTSSSSGDYQLSVSVAAIDLVVIANDYKVLYQQNIAISGDKLIPVSLEPDYAYENP